MDEDAARRARSIDEDAAPRARPMDEDAAPRARLMDDDAARRARPMDEEGARRAFEDALATYRQDFGTFFLARLLGLEISYPDETCVITFDAADFLFNPQGTLHGGVIATVMDISMGHLLHRATGPATTLEMKTQYLRAVRGGRLTCTGRFLRRGKSVSFLASELVDDAGELVAFATATWTSLRPSTPPQ